MRVYIFVAAICMILFSCKNDRGNQSYISGEQIEDSITLDNQSPSQDTVEILEDNRPVIPVQVCDSLVAEYARLSYSLFVEKKETVKGSIEGMKNTASFYYCKTQEKFSQAIDSIDSHYLNSSVDLDNVF